MKYTIRRVHIALVLVMLLGFLLRSYDLSNNPPGFFVDEATHGLDAYSLWHTGRDYHKALLPIFFKETGEYRSPVWIYFSAPIIGIIGKSVESVRFSSALQGVISIILMYAVGKRLFKSRQIGLIAAFILSISPWHIFMSRIGFEIVTYVMTSLFFIVCLLRSRDSSRFTPIIFLGFFLSFFSYTVARIISPLIFILFGLTHWYVIKAWLRQRVFWAWCLLTFTVFVFLLVFYAPPYSFFTRWQQVKPDTIQMGQVVTGYINNFTTDFLLTKGDTGFPGQSIYRHSYPGIGELYLVQWVLMVIGVCIGLLQRQWKKSTLFLLGCVCIFPLGSSIANMLPFATRSALGIIPFTLLAALGLNTILQWKTTSLLWYTIARSTLAFSVIVWILYSFHCFVPLIEAYRTNSKASSWDGWQYGYTQAVEKLSRYADKFDELIITHRYSSNEFLFAFFDIREKCLKCVRMTNPISIRQTGDSQLFAIRADDLVQANQLYPQLTFYRIDSVRSPGGQTELMIGFFQSK